jgi:DNA-binding NarL/FixJ family response regulator
MIKLIIADDHKLVRDGLKAMLAEKEEVQVVGEASSGNELIATLTGSQAQVVLMDINMPEMNGLQATQHLKEHFPHVKVLVLSMMEQKKYVAEAIKAGAVGYLLKTTDSEELFHAIQLVARGEQYISTQITMNMLRNMHFPQEEQAAISSFFDEDTRAISKRELEVLQLIAQGYTNQEIADQLFTSKRTIESHRQSLLEKTGSKNTATLIRYASRHHLIGESRQSGLGG